MASKKDQRRPDLVVPYVEPKDNSEPDMTGTLGSVLPMVSIITKNKAFGWVAVLFATQSYLTETPVMRKRSTTPAIFTVAMALLSAVMAYLPLFFQSQQKASTGTEAPAAAPKPT